MSEPVIRPEIFQQAQAQFLDSLSDDERSTVAGSCLSADQLIADIKNLNHGTKTRSWGRRVIQCINSFKDALSPYFQIVDIFVSSNPEYAALVWGSIRLIFQLANNYVSFLEKLQRVLDRITDVLPQYTKIAEICSKGPTNRLKSSLCRVYVDLLRFCHSLLRVFTKKDGRAKRSPFVVAGLLWKPFDARFEDILDDFRFHGDVMNTELKLVQLDDAKKLQETMETMAGKKDISEITRRVLELNQRIDAAGRIRQEREMPDANDEALRRRYKEQLYEKLDRIRRWISPPEFAQEFERAREQTEEGTAEWLFDETLFTTWLTGTICNNTGPMTSMFGHRALWVQGNPGCGKTILAASTVEELKSSRRSADGSKPEVLYSFFRSELADMHGPLVMLRSCLSQLLQSSREEEEIIDKFAFIMDEASSGQLVAIRNEMVELLHLCTPSSRETFLVVDGLDETNDVEAVVKDLLTLTNKESSLMKVIIFSRPNVAALYDTVPEDQVFNIGKRNGSDIERYLSIKLAELLRLKLFPSKTDTSDLLQHLILGADGMFLWAKLMVRFLKSPALTRSQRSDIVTNVHLPEGLETMYGRITTFISRSNQVERDLCRKVITWTLYAKRPLTAKEMQVAASPKISSDSPEDEEDEKDNDPEYFLRAVIICCGGLVDVQEMHDRTFGSFPVSSFQFIHLSVREFLLNFDSSLEKASPDILNFQLAHHLLMPRTEYLSIIAQRCLQTLNYKLPSQPLSGSIQEDITNVELHQNYPLCGYSAAHWVEHIEEVITYGLFDVLDGAYVLELISQFLQSGRVLMAYIEASYVLRTAPGHERLLRCFEQLRLTSSRFDPDKIDIAKIVKDGLEFCRYLKVLEKDWGEQLYRSPKCIWEEATAFTSSRLTMENANIRFRSLAIDPPQDDSISSRYLAKTSEVRSDGKTVAILSVWPSKTFEKHMQWSMRPIESMLFRLCTGWLARYELWTVSKDPVQSVDICIPLDPAEVERQLKRSLWQSDPSWTDGTLRVQFPIAISSNVDYIAILRTVYKFTVSDDHQARMSAVQLPEQIIADDRQSSFRDFLSPSNGSRRHTRSLSQEKPRSHSPARKSRLSLSRLFRSSSQTRSSSPHSDNGEYDPRNGTSFTNTCLDTFTLSFDQKGSLLLLLRSSNKVSNQSEHGPRTISLYKIGFEKDLAVAPLASAPMSEAYTSSQFLLPPRLLSHPREDVAIWFVPGDSELAHIEMWAYSIPGSSPMTLSFAGSLPFENVKDVHFSSCGNFLVIQSDKSTVPSVVPIDWTSLFGQSRPTPLSGRVCAPDQSTPDAMIKKPGSGPVIQVLAPDNEAVIRGGSTVTTDGKRAAGITLQQTGSDISIRMWQRDGSESPSGTKEEVVQLLKLPAWDHLAQSSVTMSMPSDAHDNSIKMILSEPVRKWQHMLGEADSQLPAIVSRDLNSLNTAHVDGGLSLGAKTPRLIESRR